MGTDRPTRTERPSIQVADLAQLYARGELPCAPEHVGELVEAEFGPIAGPDTVEDRSGTDPLEAFCDAWGSASLAPDTPQLPR